MQNNKSNKKILASLLGLLLLTMLFPIAAFAQNGNNETMEADEHLYVWDFEDEGSAIATVYGLTEIDNLDVGQTYRVDITRLSDGWLASRYTTEFATSSANVYFEFSRMPSTLYGTYNATLYRLVGAQWTLVAFTNFGVCGFSGPAYNVGQRGTLYGGGALNGTEVVINDDTLDDVFNATLTADAYGNFVKQGARTFTEDDLNAIEEYSATITLTTMQGVEDVSATPTYTLTDELLLQITTDKEEYARTETVNVDVRVLFQDYTPNIAATVTVEFDNEHEDAKWIDLTWNSATSSYKGSNKIQYNNATGEWTLTAFVEDPAGNDGEISKPIDVTKAILNVESIESPPLGAARGSYVDWEIKVTYPDGMNVTLNTAASEVRVINVETNQVVGYATLSAVPNATGYYIATYYVPTAADINATYRFHIPAHGLQDTVDVVETNTGPVPALNSTIFTIGEINLIIDVDTYTVGFTQPKQVFSPGENIAIRADITYPSTLPMASGIVRATIYFPNGTAFDTRTLTFSPELYVWQRDNIVIPQIAGNWTVVVEANDVAGNMGTGSTWFFVSGLAVPVAEGTVGPTTTRTAGITSGSIYKSLGTNVPLTGSAFPPNTNVTITVDIPSYTTNPTVARVTTNSQGTFSTSFLFPTAPKGTYTITATGGGVTATGLFTVIPGLEIDPEVIIGSALMFPVATGFPADFGVSNFMLNGTDALPVLFQAQTIMGWATNANGTLVSHIADKPGFLLPIIQPGTYNITLVTDYYSNSVPNGPMIFGNGNGESVSASKMVYVVNSFAELTDALNDINSSLEDLDAKIVEVNGTVATIETKVGQLQTSLSSLDAKVTSISNKVATIETKLGTVQTDISALNPRITLIEDTLAIIYTDVAEMAVEVDEINAIVSQICDDVATVQTDVGTLQGTITDVDGNIATVQTDVGTIKADLGTIKADIGEVKDAVTDEIGGIKDDISGELSMMSMLLYVAIALALVAAIAAIVSILMVRRKIAG